MFGFSLNENDYEKENEVPYILFSNVFWDIMENCADLLGSRLYMPKILPY